MSSAIKTDWLSTRLDNVPGDLRSHARWLVWRPDSNGRKVPHNSAHPHLKGVDPSDPKVWSDFATASNALESKRVKVAGLGFALGRNGDGTTLSGIDLDDCRDPHTGTIDQWARDIVNLADSYTEISPSGTGVKIFGIGALPENSPAQGKIYKIEIYDRKRYFTVTGRHLEGTPRTLRSFEPQLRQIHELVNSKDVIKLLAVFGFDPRDNGANKVFLTCPWRHEHSGDHDAPKDAAILRNEDGTLGFNCFHSHCANRTIKDIRELFGLTTPQTPKHEKRTVTLTYANTLTPRPVKWLWEGRLALGTLSLLAGREGIGKTTCAYSLAAQISRGTLPGLSFGTPRTVIVAATEDSWEQTILPRLMAADGDLSRIARVDVVTSAGHHGVLSLPDDIAGLADAVKAADAAMVLLDPLISRLNAKLDTHKDAEVRQGLEPLVQLADNTQAVVLGIIHVNKSGSRDPLNSVMGSRAFTAVARTVLYVVEDDEDEDTRILGIAKNNLGRSDLNGLKFTIANTLVTTTSDGEIWTGKITWTGETDKSVRDVVEAGTTERTQTQADEAAEWLIGYLRERNGAAESRVIKQEAEKIGIKERTLKRALKKAKVAYKPVGSPPITIWHFAGAKVDLVTLAEAQTEAEMMARAEAADAAGLDM